MTRPHLGSSSVTLVLTATLGCTLNQPGTSTESTSNPGTGDDSGTGTGEATIEPLPTSSGTTGEPTTGPTGGDTSSEAVWCHGFDPALTGLTVDNGAHVKIVEGSPLPAECGGQGTLMIPIYPHFGGFMPTEDDVSFDVVLDVDGFNLGPTGHFFEKLGHAHEVNCAEEETYGGYYSYSFIPIFPPDAIPDINVIDGKPGVLKVTLHGPDGDVPFTAAVVLSAQIDECGYGYG